MSASDDPSHRAAEEINRAIAAHSRRVSHAVAECLGNAALLNKGGVMVTHGPNGSTVAYDPDTPFLAIVHQTRC